MSLVSGNLPDALSGNVAKNDFNIAMDQLDAAFPLATVNIAAKACTYLHGAVNQVSVSITGPAVKTVLDTGAFDSLASDILILYFIPLMYGVLEALHNVTIYLYDEVGNMQTYLHDPLVTGKKTSLMGMAYKTVAAGSHRYYVQIGVSGTETLVCDFSGTSMGWIVALELRR